MSYATTQQIASYLGVTFTPEQTAQVEQLNLAVAVWIDRYTGRTWETGSATVADESHVTYTDTIYLYHPPIASVTAMDVRTSPTGGGPWTTLDPSQYELTDPERGTVTVPGASGGQARVDYTRSVEPLPEDVEYAAILLGSHRTARMLAVQRAASLVAAHPELAGVESASVGQNAVTVRLSPSVTGGAAGAAEALSENAIDSAILAILDRYRRYVLA